jgi:tRNA A-37 threonylcarbamoyl transferase component Bud32
MSLEAGQVFAGYTILRVLGSGGMGQVYLVSHPRLPRDDALKVLPPELTADAEFRARFVREADLAAGLSHPHIVRVHDRGEENGQFWISMAYVPGTDVGRLLRDHYPGGMPIDEVAPIIAAVASALDYAHHRGLLHRDIKPANILLTDPDGQARRVFLADFGIARRIDDATGLTATNMTVGTAAYAAPEQLKGEPIDGRADQYALACTAFHLLTGAQPYVDSNPAVVISQHVYAPPPSIGAHRPELAWLDPVFATAMAKEPSGRFGSCGQFAAQLGGQPIPGFAYAAEIPLRADNRATQPSVAVAGPTVPLRPKRPAWKRTGVLVSALLGVGLLVAGGVFAGQKLTQSPPKAANTPAPAAAAPSKTPAPNAGPLTGVYRVDFARIASMEGVPPPGAAPTTETWGISSVCRPTGCVATATRLTGESMQLPTMVLDQVGDSWLAVSVGSSTCKNVQGEIWETFTVQPRADGTLSGEATEMMDGCANRRGVTFTRTGDVDVSSLADPNTLSPRVASPAEALRGRYQNTNIQPNGYRDEEGEYTVVTECLRTGDRCISLFHKPPAAALALVFDKGTWTHSREFDARCTKGGTSHLKLFVPFPLPQPPQDPITLLTGHGHEDITGSSPCKSTDVEMQFRRVGD